uniref:Uncharacterized protein n=1 Tax=Myotis myotis TaxID=51298 RepID=A0A7J7SRU7_MYOMY|nr:hypothetical protein mMyoMyo1_009352 [Myotis myotis]
MFSLHWLVCDLIFKPERAGGSRSQDPSASPNQTLAAIVPTAPAKPRLFPQLPSPVLSSSSRPQFHSIVSIWGIRYLFHLQSSQALITRRPSLGLTTILVVTCCAHCPFSRPPRPCHGCGADVTDMPGTGKRRWHFHFSVHCGPQKNEKQGNASKPF